MDDVLFLTLSSHSSLFFPFLLSVGLRCCQLQHAFTPVESINPLCTEAPGDKLPCAISVLTGIGSMDTSELRFFAGGGDDEIEKVVKVRGSEGEAQERRMGRRRDEFEVDHQERIILWGKTAKCCYMDTSDVVEGVEYNERVVH